MVLPTESARFGHRNLGVETPEEKVPLYNLMKHPVVTLVESLAELFATIPTLGTMTGECLTRSNQILTSRPGCPLDLQEIAAVRLYTTEFSSGPSLYQMVNTALRSNDRAQLEPYRKYLRLLIGALMKLPHEPAMLFRGVRLSLSEIGMSDGMQVTWWAITSASDNVAILNDFCGTQGDRVVFTIKAKRAVLIRDFSMAPLENERVLLPGTRFRVQGIADGGNGLKLINLVEIVSPFPTIT